MVFKTCNECGEESDYGKVDSSDGNWCPFPTQLRYPRANTLSYVLTPNSQLPNSQLSTPNNSQQLPTCRLW